MEASQSPLLDYGCSAWRTSSQAASNILAAGHKLWTKSDLQDIEQQLAQSEKQEVFTVRSIDGATVRIKNPMFGQRYPIWEPRVVFQDYWRLVKTEPDRTPETYHCSYLLDWVNTSARSFRGVVDDSDTTFELNRRAWNESTSSKLLRSKLQQMPHMKEVSKIVCFGLGDFCRQPAEWLTRQMGSDELKKEAGTRMIQHAIALTIAEVCHSKTGVGIQLLAQDPDYTRETEQILERASFSVVGNFGAGGFAQVDDNSVVFSVFVKAPLKQIVADIARPLLIISTGFETFNNSAKPWVDAESPRTKEMWEEYDRISFPIAIEDAHMTSKLREVYMYIRKAV